MKTFLFILMLLVAPFASAENSMVLTGLSYHLGECTYKTPNGREWDCNEMNVGVGIEHNDWRWVLVNNSYRKWSTGVMWTPSTQVSENLSVGMRLGAVTGYDDTPMDLPIAPVIGIELDYRIDNLHIVPAFQVPSIFTVHLQVDF